jgi:hypothetical protein
MKQREGNLPPWRGASEVYSRAYRYMERCGYDPDLGEALAKGREETIKGILLNASTAEFLAKARKC